jgi:LiaI-LiaF-like transmembrane region
MTDPLDDTQPHPVVPPAPQPNVLSSAAPGPAGPSPSDSSGTPATPPPPATDKPLQATPQSAPSEWREPPWYPPRERDRSRGPSVVAIVIGLVILAIGLYYFIDRTLGIDLPSVNWGSLWPLILIGIGAVIVLRAMSRRP